jgi:Transposase IS4
MASRKRRSTAEVLKQLGPSDDEQFDENDSDRDSYDQQDDVELLNNAGSEATEVYYNSTAISDSGNDSSDSGPVGADTEIPVAHDASCSMSFPVVTPRVWERVNTNYTPKVDFEYRHTAGMNSSIHLTADSQPIDFFKLFLTDEVVSFMVDESNRFSEQYLQKSALKPKARAHQWNPTAEHELKKFLGFIFLTGHIKKPTI